MKKYFIRIIWFCSPFTIFIILYIVLDPFNVIYRSEYGDVDFHWNRDVWSSKLFIKNHEKYTYDSFIFGSSRTMAYSTLDWSPYIHDTNTFHFDASTESILGIWSKIKYIDAQGIVIKNALIVCDSSLLAQTEDQEKVLFCKYYKIAETSPIRFHLIFFRAFCTNLFFVKYIDFELFHQRRPYMKFVLPEKANAFLDNMHNNTFFPVVPNIHGKDSVAFYGNKEHFPDRPLIPEMGGKCLHEKCIKMLTEINDIFTKDKTQFKVIISPLYNQRIFNDTDLVTLKNIFGKKNVFDYSGKNSITDNKTNYYETSHYKPSAGRYILRDIYTTDK